MRKAERGGDSRAKGTSQIDTEKLMRNCKEGDVCEAGMESECVSDTRTKEENIGPNTDRFKVMVYALLHTCRRTPPLSVLSFLSVPVSRSSLCMCVVIWLFVFLMSHTCMHILTNTHTSTLQWLFIFVDLIVSICLSVTPLSNLPSAWQELIDWPAHLSFSQSLTRLSNLHISIPDDFSDTSFPFYHLQVSLPPFFHYHTSSNTYTSPSLHTSRHHSHIPLHSLFFLFHSRGFIVHTNQGAMSFYAVISNPNGYAGIIVITCHSQA